MAQEMLSFRTPVFRHINISEKLTLWAAIAHAPSQLRKQIAKPTKQPPKTRWLGNTKLLNRLCTSWRELLGKSDAFLMSTARILRWKVGDKGQSSQNYLSLLNIKMIAKTGMLNPFQTNPTFAYQILVRISQWLTHESPRVCCRDSTGLLARSSKAGFFYVQSK